MFANASNEILRLVSHLLRNKQWRSKVKSVYKTQNDPYSVNWQQKDICVLVTLYNFQKSLRPSKTRGLRSNKQTPTDTLTSILRSSRAAVDNRQLTEDGSVIIVGKRRGDARHSHMFLQEACPARRTSKFCTPSGPRPTSWSRIVSTALACGTRGTGSQYHAVLRLGPPCKFGWWVSRSCCYCGCRR